MGDVSAAKVSSQQAAFGQAPPRDGMGEFNKARARELKREHWNIGDVGQRELITTNEIAYKWVQPKMV